MEHAGHIRRTGSLILLKRSGSERKGNPVLAVRTGERSYPVTSVRPRWSFLLCQIGKSVPEPIGETVEQVGRS